MANQRFHNALERRPQSVPPIWLMRQAGRYHRHYQALRARHSFIELCREPELAAEVTLGPITDFGFDVAILFSDLLFPLDALGMGLSYGDSGPRLEWQLTAESVGQLRSAAEALPAMDFQREAMLAARNVLPSDTSLIGFVGGPWTLFAYAAEGTHAGGLVRAKAALPLYDRFHEIMLPLLEGNIELQLRGGAEIVMIFDTAAGDLSPALFQALVLPGLQALAKKFPKKLGYYAKGVQSAYYRDPFFASGLLAGQGYDHHWDLAEVLTANKCGFVQGNFDQSWLAASPDLFRAELRRYLDHLLALAPEQRLGWVCGLGHGVIPQAREENVRAFVEMVRERC